MIHYHVSRLREDDRPVGEFSQAFVDELDAQAEAIRLVKAGAFRRAGYIECTDHNCVVPVKRKREYLGNTLIKSRKVRSDKGVPRKQVQAPQIVLGPKIGRIQLFSEVNR